jgi:hypothetical protein
MIEQIIDLLLWGHMDRKTPMTEDEISNVLIGLFVIAKLEREQREQKNDTTHHPCT